jgi:hypothetical protein
VFKEASIITQTTNHNCRSQWPSGLRYELSSPVGSNPTGGIDVCVCVHSVFVLSSVYVAALRRADLLSKYSYRLCIRLGNSKRGQDKKKINYLFNFVF